MRLCVLLLISVVAAAVVASPKDDLIIGNRRFSANLYNQILKTKPNQNFVFSPFTVQTILAALASAAPNSNSETVTQIRNSLSLPNTNANTEAAFQGVLFNLNKADDDFKVFDASKMYFAHGYTAEQWFKDIARTVYHAEVETVNFGDSFNTAQNINAWVSKQTNNKIQDFISSGDISTNTQNVLVNALYLMGKWEKPFERYENVRRKFYGPQATTEVEMMTNSQTYEYAENNNGQYLKMELVREGGGAYVVFVLPTKREGLLQLEANIAEPLQNQNYYATKVDVTLPKFTINSELKLKPILQNLGVNKLFNWGLELTGLRYPGHGYTIVSDVYQKSFIEVTEWGITAASATEAEVQVDDPADHKVFTADHPFIFQVIVNDVIVFAGRVVSP